MFYFDPLYFLFLLPGMLFAMWAQFKVQSTYAKWKQVPNSRGLTGAQATRYMLDSYGLQHVGVEEAQGVLSDHYDPNAKVLRLSPENFRVPSVAAVGIAAHEMGHALQDKDGYGPLRLRSALVLPANLGSQVGIWIILAGFMFNAFGLQLAGLVIFALGFVFTLITLPVEFDASNRALALIQRDQLLSPTEMQGARSVLNAAAWTYVAAAAAALFQVLYFAIRIFGGRRD